MAEEVRPDSNGPLNRGHVHIYMAATIVGSTKSYNCSYSSY
jgi:hypothetical protein